MFGEGGVTISEQAKSGTAFHFFTANILLTSTVGLKITQ
jgi:hypothetical protein